MVGFHFPLVCMLRCVLCSRSLCCSLSCFCSSGTRHRPGNVFVAGHPHIWQKTDKLLINLTYCVWFLWARSQGHSHKIYVIIERARPHISPTPYSYTQTHSARSSTYTIRRLSSPTAASATHLKPVGRELRAMLKFQFPRLNNEAICFRLACDVSIARVDRPCCQRRAAPGITFAKASAGSDMVPREERWLAYWLRLGVCAKTQGWTGLCVAISCA